MSLHLNHQPCLRLVPLALVFALAGCVSRTPAEPNFVDVALAPFVGAGYRCSGPSADHSAFRQWHCSLTSAELVDFDLLLDADEDGIKQVTAAVDQSRAPSPTVQIIESYFDRVTDIDLGQPGTSVKRWVATHIAGGGQEQVGTTFVTLDESTSRAHLVLFVGH